MRYREEFILDIGNYVSRPSYYATKNLPVHLGIDGPGWSIGEERYMYLHSSSTSNWDRAVDGLMMAKSLLLRPGYHGDISCNAGRCRKMDQVGYLVRIGLRSYLRG